MTHEEVREAALTQEQCTRFQGVVRDALGRVETSQCALYLTLLIDDCTIDMKYVGVIADMLQSGCPAPACLKDVLAEAQARKEKFLLKYNELQQPSRAAVLPLRSRDDQLYEEMVRTNPQAVLG